MTSDQQDISSNASRHIRPSKHGQQGAGFTGTTLAPAGLCESSRMGRGLRVSG